jgi:hypothetical protein
MQCPRRSSEPEALLVVALPRARRCSCRSTSVDSGTTRRWAPKKTIRIHQSCYQNAPRQVASALCQALDFWEGDAQQTPKAGPRITNEYWGVPAGYILERPWPSFLSYEGLRKDLEQSPYNRTLLYSEICREAQNGLPNELTLLFTATEP